MDVDGLTFACAMTVEERIARRLGGVARGATPDGRVDVVGFLRGFAREPLVTLRAAIGARRALKRLEALA